MKKARFKVSDENVLKFLDTLISIDAKPLISQSKEGFLETVTHVWVLASQEQLEAFVNNGFKPDKIV